MLFDPGACCDCPPAYSHGVYLRVVGCDGSPRAGATVEVYTNSTRTTLLASGVTDASGLLFFGDTALAVRYAWVLAPNARLVDTGANFTTSASFPTISVGSNPASGYYCTTFCPDPLPATLYATAPLVGTLTLTRTGTTGAQWRSPEVVVDYPGCPSYGCPPRSIAVRLAMSGALQTLDYQARWSTGIGCPPEFSFGSTYRTVLSMTSPAATSCPPAFSASFSRTPGSTSNVNDALQCGEVWDGTVTE